MYYKTFHLLALALPVQAHMSLWYPGPLGGAKEAKLAPANSDVDHELNFPLGCCDSDGKPTVPSPGVCRGHLDMFDAEIAQTTWQPGQDAYFQLSNYTYTADAPGGTHYGGSCQIGFSADRGETWKIAASYNGNCPLRGEDGSPEAQTFHFKVPTGMPEGKALFAWVWLNREHEFFMNCAAVQIGGRSGDVASTHRPMQPSMPAIESVSTPGPVRWSPTPEKGSTYTTTRIPSSSRIAASALCPTLSASLIQHDNELLPDGPDRRRLVEERYNCEHAEIYGGKVREELSPGQRSSDDQHHQIVRHRTVDDRERDIKHRSGSLECHCRASSGCLPGTQRLTARNDLHMARHDSFKKRVDACDWDSAPSMIVSYYTVDAACAPNAKLNVPESDDFEIGWDETCGSVDGDSEFPIKIMDCEMYGQY